MGRYLCAAPAYIARRGLPMSLQDLSDHDTIEMPSPNGRPRTWSFERNGESQSVEVKPKISSNEALLIVRLIREGSGIGIISGYMCAEAIESGQLELLLPEWSAPPVDVSLVFPSRLKMPTTVRAFVDYMRETNGSTVFWKREPSVSNASTPKSAQLKRRRR
jgi:LysR family transcriptional regulator for bpeEF and oprC